MKSLKLPKITTKQEGGNDGVREQRHLRAHGAQCCRAERAEEATDVFIEP